MAGSRLDEFAEKAVRKSGEEYYFDRAVTLDIIARCENEKITIYGIDGALIENGDIHEPIDAILVLGNDPQAYAEARKHVTRDEYSNLVWCLTLDNDPNETA